jgi:hypothetical protein
MVVVAVLMTGVAAAEQARFEATVPVRAITQGPKAHWFGYYDKFQFDPTNRYVLGMETDFEGRRATAEDTVRLGMVDIEDGDKWIPLGESGAWSWQQGCMLQWRPESDSEIVYNIRENGDRFRSVVQDVFTGEKRTLPRAIYSVSPDGKTGVCVNFARIDDTRQGYGYVGGVDPGKDDIHPDNDGIFIMDLDTGESNMIATYAQIAAIPWNSKKEGKHWFNHFLFNPVNDRFIFLHRARISADPEQKRWVTRMFTIKRDGTGLHCVADDDMVSHFIWRNESQILAWARDVEIGNRFFLYTDESNEKEIIGDEVLTRDGHCTYSPDGEWICIDTYPDKEQMQHLMLYRPSDGKMEYLGKFFRPKPETNEFRCDLHPGWSRDGRYLCIDSMHTDDQRQMYLIEVSGIVGK